MNLFIRVSPILMTLIIAGCGSIGVSKSSWVCLGEKIVTYDYFGGKTANINNGETNRDYIMKLNDAKTIATGKTAEGTPFTCSKRL